MEPEELAGAILRLQEWAGRHAPEPEPPVRARLRAHFGEDPIELPVVSRPLQPWDRPNVQVAMDEWLGGRESDVLGLSTMHGYRAGLAELVRGGDYVGEITLGGVEYVTVPLGDEESITCVQAGLWLVRDGDERLVVMVRSSDRGDGEQLGLEVMAPDAARAEAVLAAIRRLMAEHNVYRGRSMATTSVDLATSLQPAMVVLEDVDLVALDRHSGETSPILFELLNAMDGSTAIMTSCSC